jgi:hypothetical protein
MERMQLQEDKCRPGLMQLKLKHQLCWGFASHSSIHPPPEFVLHSSHPLPFSHPEQPIFPLRLTSAYPHASLKTRNREVVLCFPVKPHAIVVTHEPCCDLAVGCFLFGCPYPFLFPCLALVVVLLSIPIFPCCCCCCCCCHRTWL